MKKDRKEDIKDGLLGSLWLGVCIYQISLWLYIINMVI